MATLLQLPANKLRSYNLPPSVGLPPTPDPRRPSGFTLIELLTAMAIFSILIILISGAFARFVLNQRREIAEQELQEDVRFGMEIFNREARTGYGNTYRSGLDEPGTTITFRNQSLNCVQYRFTEVPTGNTDNPRGLIERAEIFEGAGGECDGADYPNPEPLTGNETDIESLAFVPQLAEEGEDGLTRQGFITVIARVGSRNPSVAPLDFQSTVTSRQVTPFNP